MEVGGQLHTVAALPFSELTQYQLECWMPCRDESHDKKKKLLILSATEPRFLGRRTRSLVTTPTGLFHAVTPTGIASTTLYYQMKQLSQNTITHVNK
jgi:hypothetical protein